MTVLRISNLIDRCMQPDLQHDGSFVFHIGLDHSSDRVEIPLSLSRGGIWSRQPRRMI